MTEQERFEASIATRIHPVNFTKVNDLPILGWNGAKPNDYVDPKIQQHWITWQAAQQKEGFVLVPVESIQEVLSWLDDNSDAFEYAASSHVRECIKHRDILQQAIEAAQEAE